VLAAVAAVWLCAAAQGQLLNDPGFQLATSDTQTSNSNWALTVNFPDGASPAASFKTASFARDPADPNDAVGTGIWFRSFEGNQNAGVDPPADATLSQIVPNVSGGDYFLTFSARREANFTATAWYATLSSDGTGGSDTIDLLVNLPNDGLWYTRNLQLTGVSAGDNLTVQVVMDDGVVSQLNPQSAFVDNFQLVPEPASALLLGGGLLLLPRRLRRRGRRRPAR